MQNEAREHSIRELKLAIGLVVLIWLALIIASIFCNFDPGFDVSDPGVFPL